MKYTFEITDEELAEVLRTRIKLAVADRATSWKADREIREAVNERFGDVVLQLVQEELENAPLIRQKIIAAVEAKLTGQINALLRAKS